MAVSYLEELPFCNVSEIEFEREFATDKWNAVFEHSELCDYLHKLNSGPNLRELNFGYSTPEQFNNSVSRSAANISSVYFI